MAVRLGRILLIQPRSRKFVAQTFATGELNSYPPTGILTLASVLKCHGYEVRVMDMLVQKITKKQFEQILAEFQPDVVGINSLTETFRVAEQIAFEVKRQLERCRIVFGGVFPTFEYETVMENREVDYVIRFEGENGFLELLEHLSHPEQFHINRVAGLVYRDGDRLCCNPVRAASERLDAQPFVDREIVPISSYTHGGTIVSGRGCGYHCIFCSSASMFGAAARVRSAENLFAEVYYLNHKFGLKKFHFVDQAFTASRQRVKTFCRYLADSHLDIHWLCMSRIDTIERDLLERMKSAGCNEIEYGIESGDPEVLRKIGKGITLERASKVIEWSRGLGMTVTCFFILGHYADTPESMKRTIALAKRWIDQYGVEVIAHMNTPFPGTYQYEHASELGLGIHAEDWDDFTYADAIVSNDSFTVDQLRSSYFDFIKEVELNLN